MTQIGSVSIAYDASSGLTATFAYDAIGNRVQKTASGITTVYVHDAFGQLAAEYDSVGVTPACTTCYLSYDQVGSIRLVTDQNGNVVTRHDYLPFGEEIMGGTGDRNGNNFSSYSNVTQGFTGQEADAGTPSLDFFNARHLAAALGAFTQPDPMNAGADILHPQSWNAYGYVLGNPLAFVDPSGMFLGAPPPNLDPDPVDASWFCLSYRIFALVSTPSGGGGGAGGETPPAPPKVNNLQPAKNVVRTGSYLTLDCGWVPCCDKHPSTNYQARHRVWRLSLSEQQWPLFVFESSGWRSDIDTSLFKSPPFFVSGIVDWFHTHPLVPGSTTIGFRVSIF